MGYISARKARLQARLTSCQSQIAALEDALEESVATNIQNYSFDSGEASQKVSRRKISDMQDNLDRLYARESHLINELSNMGIVSLRLRRKSC